jgi:hypothetical protein
MKTVTVIPTLGKDRRIDWADLVLKLPVDDIKHALPFLLHIDDDVLLLRNDATILNKNDVERLFKYLKRSAIVKYDNEVVGYFVARNDKEVVRQNKLTFVVRHYSIKV